MHKIDMVEVVCIDNVASLKESTRIQKFDKFQLNNVRVILIEKRMKTLWLNFFLKKKPFIRWEEVHKTWHPKHPMMDSLDAKFWLRIVPGGMLNCYLPSQDRCTFDRFCYFEETRIKFEEETRIKFEKKTGTSMSDRGVPVGGKQDSVKCKRGAQLSHERSGDYA